MISPNFHKYSGHLSQNTNRITECNQNGIEHRDTFGILIWLVWNWQVSLEYGLVELMNNRAIRYPPSDPHTSHIWNLSREELVSALPSGVVDTSVPPLVPQVRDQVTS